MTKKRLRKLPDLLSIDELAEALKITREAAHSYLKVTNLPRIILKNNEIKIQKNVLMAWFNLN